VFLGPVFRKLFTVLAMIPGLCHNSALHTSYKHSLQPPVDVTAFDHDYIFDRERLARVSADQLSKTVGTYEQPTLAAVVTDPVSQMILDSGSTHDVVSDSDLIPSNRSEVYTIPDGPSLRTANKTIVADKRLMTTITSLNITKPMTVLENSPPLLGMANRTLDDDYDFYWKRKCYPVLVTPDHSHYRLDLSSRTPVVPTDKDALEDHFMGTKEFTPPSFALVPVDPRDFAAPNQSVLPGSVAPPEGIDVPDDNQGGSSGRLSQKEKENRLYIHTHLHMNAQQQCPGCEICIHANQMREASRTVPIEIRDVATKPLEHLHFDFVEAGENLLGQDYEGYHSGLLMYDEFTRQFMFDSVLDHRTVVAALPLRHMIGKDLKKVGQLESDKAPTFTKLAKYLRLPHRVGTPRRPNANRIERCMYIFQRGLRALLYQSAAPLCLWTLSGSYWTLLHSYLYVFVDSKGKSEVPIRKRYPGTVIPHFPVFGSACTYIPLEDSNRLKLQQKAIDALFVGFAIAPGGLATREALVIPLSSFIEGRVPKVVHTRDVRYPKELSFPLKEFQDKAIFLKYQQNNVTMTEEQLRKMYLAPLKVSYDLLGPSLSQRPSEDIPEAKIETIGQENPPLESELSQAECEALEVELESEAVEASPDLESQSCSSRNLGKLYEVHLEDRKTVIVEILDIKGSLLNKYTCKQACRWIPIPISHRADFHNIGIVKSYCGSKSRIIELVHDTSIDIFPPLESSIQPSVETKLLFGGGTHIDGSIVRSSVGPSHNSGRPSHIDPATWTCFGPKDRKKEVEKYRERVGKQLRKFLRSPDLPPTSHESVPTVIATSAIPVLQHQSDIDRIFSEAMSFYRTMEDSHTDKRPPSMIECCCSANSSIGNVGRELGVSVFRFHVGNSDIGSSSTESHMKELVDRFSDLSMHISLPCTSWTKLTDGNIAQYGQSFCDQLEKDRIKSLEGLRRAIRIAEMILSKGGHVSFEWPLDCYGWQITELKMFILKWNLYNLYPNGCALGVVDKAGCPICKPYRIVTSSPRLAETLRNQTCRCAKNEHVSCEGSRTSKTAFYTKQLASKIVRGLCLSQTKPVHLSTPCISGPVSQYDDVFAGACFNDDGEIPEAPFRGAAGITPREILGLVTKVIPATDPAFRTAEALEALHKELSRLRTAGVWNEKNVQESWTVKRKALDEDTDVMIGRLFAILGRKNDELVIGGKPDPKVSPLKSRVVFQGSNIDTASNSSAVDLFQEISAAPVSIEQFRASTGLGAVQGWGTTVRDAEQAYIQSRIDADGRIKTWIRLPRQWWPSTWFNADGSPKYKDPVCLLVLSLYGHPEAGALWESHCSRIMLNHGFEKVFGNPGTWIHKITRSIMNIYVDDFALTASVPKTKLHWRSLEKDIRFKDPEEPLERYLGAYYDIKLGSKAATLEVSMQDFFRDAVEKFMKETGVTKLPVVPTPSISEDYGCVEPGSLAGSAASHLMKLMFGARIGKPCSLTTISFLARRITVWSKSHDKMLHRLMAYVNSTLHEKLRGILEYTDLDSLELWIWPDADLGGDLRTTKSTSGCWIELSTPCGSRSWPVAWFCVKQTQTSCSTNESESKTILTALGFDDQTRADLNALSSALRRAVIPLIGLCEHALNRPVKVVCHEDNTQAITAVKKGYSVNLRHLHRHTRMDVGMSHEVFAEVDKTGRKRYVSEIRYAPTDTQKGDLFTKPLERLKHEAARKMIRVS